MATLRRHVWHLVTPLFAADPAGSKFSSADLSHNKMVAQIDTLSSPEGLDTVILALATALECPVRNADDKHCTNRGQPGWLVSLVREAMRVLLSVASSHNGTDVRDRLSSTLAMLYLSSLNLSGNFRSQRSCETRTQQTVVTMIVTQVWPVMVMPVAQCCCLVKMTHMFL